MNQSNLLKRPFSPLTPILILSLILAACQQTPEPTPTAVAAATATSTATTSPTATAKPTATPSPTPQPTATAAPSPTPSPTPPPAYEPIFTTADCQFTLPVEHEVTCGYLRVPENRAAANGRFVRLHVAIFASERSNPLSTIVYLEGGPGGDALETIPFTFEDNFAPLLTDHELIIFDQRGTGYSEPSLACPENSDLTRETLDDDLTIEQSQTLILDMLTACRQRLLDEDIDLAAYNSAENAADVDDLRRALGYEQWDLYGISYGTRLAQTIMRDFPNGVRSVLLDSAYPLSADLTVETIGNANRAFNTLFAGCAADPACNEAYPELESRFFALVQTLNDTPIMVPVLDITAREQREALVNGDTMLGLLFQSLYSAELIPQLPLLIDEVATNIAANGRFTTLSTLISNLLISEQFISLGMNVSVQCHEEVPFGSEAAAETAVSAYPQLANAFRASSNTGPFAYTVCNAWDVGQADAVENKPISSNIPTLILAGEYDPITPPAWGELVAATLTQATFLEFPGLGHAASTSADCPQSITRAFFANPTTPPDTSCRNEMAGPAFAIAGADAETAVVLEPFSETDPFPMTGVVPGDWEMVGPGTYARGKTALDQTVIIQIAAPAAPGLDATLFLELISAQLGVADIGESVGSYGDTNGRSWTRYATTVQGLPVDLATAETNTGIFMVALFSTEEEREGLITAVFQPAMDALAVAE